MQPAAQGVASTDRMRLIGEDQEGCLKGILDVVLTPEHGPAGGQDHRPVTDQQGLECGRVLRRGITGQQLPVTQPGGRPRDEEVAKVPVGRPQTCTRHAIGSL